MDLKRHIPVMSAVIMLILLMCFGCSASAENLLENADFVHIGNDGLPAGWYTDAYVLETGYTVFSVTEGDQQHPVVISINFVYYLHLIPYYDIELFKLIQAIFAIYLRIVRRCSKYSGSGAWNSMYSPVVGCKKPNVPACNTCPSVEYGCFARP